MLLQQQSLEAHPLFLKNIPWTEAPFFENLLASSSYDEKTKEQIRFYATNGYLILHPQIEGFDQIAQEITSSLAEEQRQHGSRVQDAWRYHPRIKELACHPNILEWLEILYQRRPIPFQTLNFCKGTEQATHSDLIHFSCVPQRFMAGVWFALEDVDENNGALHYFPGSHRLPVYDLHDLGLSKSTCQNRESQYDTYQQFVKELMEKGGFKKETVAIKKGSCLIWSANLFHGGDPIVDKSRTRHTQVTHYYFEGCRYYTPLYSDVYLGDMAWKEIRDISSGEMIPHQYNGKQVSLPWRIRGRYLVENVLRNSKMGREVLAKLKKILFRT